MEISAIDPWAHVPTPRHSLVQRGHTTLAGLGHIHPLELDVEVLLPELFPGEEEMGEGVQKNQQTLIFCH